MQLKLELVRQDERGARTAEYEGPTYTPVEPIPGRFTATHLRVSMTSSPWDPRITGQPVFGVIELKALAIALAPHLRLNEVCPKD